MTETKCPLCDREKMKARVAHGPPMSTEEVESGVCLHPAHIYDLHMPPCESIGVQRIAVLREALIRCRDALQTLASCHACKGGIMLGFAVHCIDCTADVDAKEEEVDLDKVVQGAWESANVALGALPVVE